jgi:hypothetical protein
MDNMDEFRLKNMLVAISQHNDLNFMQTKKGKTIYPGRCNLEIPHEFGISDYAQLQQEVEVLVLSDADPPFQKIRRTTFKQSIDLSRNNANLAPHFSTLKILRPRLLHLNLSHNRIKNFPSGEMIK